MAKTNDIIGPYILMSKLGRGAFGVVWLAEKRTALATTRVALKLPNDEDVDLEAVKQEAAIWVHASGHPNVLPIIDADIYDEQVIIVSEYAPDGSLSKWLEENEGKAPSIGSAVEMALGILAGLEHLHKRGIIHRDLKPDNILLQNETPRLADFGIARILRTTSKSTVATGTPVYMSPEAFDGKRNEQTDIWSVGVIFFQLLTGRLPFVQTDMASLLAAIITREPEPLPHSIPEPIRKVVDGALRRNPAERWQSAAEMRKALRSASQTIESADEVATPFDQRAYPLAETVPSGGLPDVNLTVPAATVPFIGKSASGHSLELQTLPAPAFAPLAPKKLTSRKKSRRGLWIGGLVVLLVVAVVIVTIKFRINSSAKRVTTSNSPMISPRKPIVITKLTNLGKVANASLSRDGEYIAYTLGNGSGSLWVAQSGINRAISQKPIQLLPDTATDFSSLAFEPTGNFLYYSDLTVLSLYRIPLIGGKPEKVSDSAVSFTFSPDGKRIAYYSRQRLMVANADGSGAQELYSRQKAGSFTQGLSWSPDGKSMAFGIRNGEDSEVVILDVSTLTEATLGNTKWLQMLDLAWLPDGSALIINGIEKQQANEIKNRQLWHLSFPNGDAYPITNDATMMYAWVSPAPSSKSFLTVQYKPATADAILVSDFR